MGGISSRHQVVLDELAEWWGDLCTRGIGSRAVLVEVPQGWGCSTLLDQFAELIGQDDGPVTLVARVQASLVRDVPGGVAGRARMVADMLAGAGQRHLVARRTGVDRPAGVVQLGLGVGALFATPLAAAAVMVAGTVVAGAVGQIADESPIGQDGVLVRAARSVAATSVRVPVVVLADDIDVLGRDMAVLLADNLISRPDGQVLLIACTDPVPRGPVHRDSLREDLASRPWLAGRIRAADADPDMGYEARAAVAAELRPELPATAVRRIARRTATFAEVFGVCAVRRLADAGQAADEAAVVAIADAAADAALSSGPVPVLAGIVAWAGGTVHAGQARGALAVLGQDSQDIDAYPGVLRGGEVVRLTDPASPALAAAAGALSEVDRQEIAAALTAAALETGASPAAGLVETVVAAQAAFHVRSDLPGERGGVLSVACLLVACLEELGDLDGAYQVAATAMAESIPGQDRIERGELSAAVLRLARKLPARSDDPLVDDLIAAAVAGGASTGLEARLWAAIDLLADRSRRETALALAEQVADNLTTRPDLGQEAAYWRLLLAFHAGQHGYPDLAQRVLAPEITAGSQDRQDAAQAILYVSGGPRADTRLQIIGCQAELDATPDSDSETRLRLHHTLACDYDILGDWRNALQHGREELHLRHQLDGPDHPSTLDTRSDLAAWTDRSGDRAETLRLYRELLPDQVRVLGPDHHETLTTRHNIATWIGNDGDPLEALRLLLELLTHEIRVLGPDHYSTLITRLDAAAYIGHCGDPAEARRLLWELLPDQVRVLGPDHRDTLTTRNNIATLTGRGGDAAGALRLFGELLPDMVQFLGPDHPATLTTRSNVAYWTGRGGDAAGALRLFGELLPDMVQFLGPDHRDTLTTRSNIAYWTGHNGDFAGALRLLRELLPDQVRVFGPDHPDTMTTRNSI
jgi:hypothetical protein